MMASNHRETIALLNEVNVGNFDGNEAARVETIAAARKLLNRLESPMERCYELMSISWIWGTLQTFKDLDIWEKWAKDEGEKSLEELAGLANVDVDINLLRACVLNRICKN
jgi:fumagillin biosynthesis methyltransferase